MPVIPFADWKPDLSPYKAQSSQLIQNVFPRLDGYGPVASVSQYSQALPGPCRGYFYARNADQSVTVFAATASKLYKLNNTDFSWTDVSKGAGSYTAVGNGEQWQFAQQFRHHGADQHRAAGVRPHLVIGIRRPWRLAAASALRRRGQSLRGALGARHLDALSRPVVGPQRGDHLDLRREFERLSGPARRRRCARDRRWRDRADHAGRFAAGA